MDSDIEIIEEGSFKVVEKKDDIYEVQSTSYRSAKIIVSTSPSKDNDASDPQTKKKVRRPPEVVAAEKRQKEAEKARKKRERDEAKLLKENEKKKRKIEREVISATKTKSEHYTYCHVGKSLLKIQGLEVTAKIIFMERNLEDQLIFDNNLENRIEFHRKEIEIVETSTSVDKMEYTCLQHVFAVLIEADTFREMILSKTFDDFVAAQQTNYSVPSSQLIVICYGEHKLPSKKLMELSISSFEETRTHFEFVNNPTDLALFLAQTLRALAKKATGEHDKLIVNIPKGIENGTKEEIAKDWWDKMLTAVARIGSSQRRAIIKRIPDPVKAVAEFRSKGYDNMTKELSNIMCDNGRRIGPAMAHRLFIMLTDTTGTQMID